MNILIAEDCSILQMINSELMNDWGYGYDLASNGIEAVELARKNHGKYDLCLMDIDMPHMNGIDATKLIREMNGYFPILALTADDTYKKACLDAGMDGFALKPCLPDDLLAKINALSVKFFKFVINPKGWEITEVMPVDQQHALELKKLKNQGLVKMRLDGPDEREVIAHKNTPNKISHDFNVLNLSMTEFLNRDTERPTICDLYRGSKNCIVETFLDEDDYHELLKTENAKMDIYRSKYFCADEESGSGK